MVGLHVSGISNESTKTTKSYSNFNDELRWLLNSVQVLSKNKQNSNTLLSPSFTIQKWGMRGVRGQLGPWLIRTLANSDLIRTSAVDNSDLG